MLTMHVWNHPYFRKLRLLKSYELLSQGYQPGLNLGRNNHIKAGWSRSHIGNRFLLPSHSMEFTPTLLAPSNLGNEFQRHFCSFGWALVMFTPRSVSWNSAMILRDSVNPFCKPLLYEICKSRTYQWVIIQYSLNKSIHSQTNITYNIFNTWYMVNNI